MLILIQVKEMPECQNMYIKSFSRCLVAHQLCCTCQVYSEKSLLFRKLEIKHWAQEPSSFPIHSAGLSCFGMVVVFRRI